MNVIIDAKDYQELVDSLWLCALECSGNVEFYEQSRDIFRKVHIYENDIYYICENGKDVELFTTTYYPEALEFATNNTNVKEIWSYVKESDGSAGNVIECVWRIENE